MPCQHRAWLDDPEQDADDPSDEQGTGDEPQHGHAPWHESGAVHQVAQNQPVPDADDEAGSEQERPIMERDQRLADRDERGGIRARSSLLAQRHDRKEAEDADGDEDAFDDTSRDEAEGEDFVHPLEDGHSTTAVPMFAMMRISSKNAPKATLVSAPAPTM